MKYKLLLAVAAAIAFLSGCASTGAPIVKAAPAVATPAGTPLPAPAANLAPSEVQSLIDKLTNVDAPAAIARAQLVVDDPKATPEEVTYAKARIVCYQTIVSIAPDLNFLHVTQLNKPAGVLDLFEESAEVAEGVNAIVGMGLPKQDIARFDVSCGWIGQRTIAIASNLGLQFVNVAAGAAALIPKP